MKKNNTKKEIAIKVENVSKTFRVPHEKHTSLKSTALNAFKKKTYEEFTALKNISFEVKKGEFFGIIGRNGSGKSTLLKILAGIYVADEGTTAIHGKLSPFLELGVGFNPELTGRENIFLGGSILGLSRKELVKKFKQIVDFSEIGEFIDMKMKNYSSGMQVRLAFSLAINVYAEILLMDEVLAVGDSNFQAKCLEEFNMHRKRGKTVVLVTHDIETVRRYCDRAILLRKGKIVKIGEVEEVANEYVYQNMKDEEKKIAREAKKEKVKIDKVNKEVRISKVDFLNFDKKRKNVFGTGEDIVIRIHYKATKNIKNPVFGTSFFTQDNIQIAGPNTRTSGLVVNEIKQSGYIDLMIKNNPFFTGTFYLTVAIFNWECTVPFDFQDKKYKFKIKSTEKNQYGIFKLESSWKI